MLLLRAEGRQISAFFSKLVIFGSVAHVAILGASQSSRTFTISPIPRSRSVTPAGHRGARGGPLDLELRSATICHGLLWAIRISSTRCGMPKWHLIGSRISGRTEAWDRANSSRAHVRAHTVVRAGRSPPVTLRRSRRLDSWPATLAEPQQMPDVRHPPGFPGISTRAGWVPPRSASRRSTGFLHPGELAEAH